MPRATKPHPGPFDPLPWLAAALLLLAVFVAYRPAASGAFVWDDNDYVSQNETLTAPGGLARIWGEPTASPQYYPLVFTTFWLERPLWGLDPRGYHEVNVLLHAASALVLWRLLRRLAVPGASVAATAFALHPVMVESVAWVSERKNTLSMLFYLLSATAYLRFARVGATGPAASSIGRDPKWSAPRSETVAKPDWGFYAAALVLFACALLSKTVTASLPAALALILWWRRGRLSARDWLALAPFFALGIGGGLLTAHLERAHVGASGAEWDYSLAQRVLIAGRAVWFYAAKLVWPANLTFVYPKWSVDPAAVWQWMFPAGVVAALAALFTLRERIGRGPVVAALIFVGTLVPALGFVNVLPMRYTFVADHYQYHASVALIAGLVAWAAANLAGFQRGRFRQGAAAVVIAALFALTLNRAGVFKDSRTLWTDTVEKAPNSWMAWVNLGHVSAARVPPDKAAALAAYRTALRLAPNVADPHYLIGITLLDTDDTAAALPEFTRAAELEPRLVPSITMIGYCLVAQGKVEDGIAQYRRAIATEPKYVKAHFLLGVALSKADRLDEAAAAFAACLAIDPTDAAALGELARCRAKQKRFPESIEAFTRLLALRPDDPYAHLGIAEALIATGRKDEATEHINRAVQLKPDLRRLGPKR